MDHHDTSSSNTPAQGNRTPPKAVYTVTERADGSRSFWTRVGSAWVNRDGSLSDVGIRASTNRALDDAVLDAVRQWRYGPLPEPREGTVQLVFNLGE